MHPLALTFQLVYSDGHQAQTVSTLLSIGILAGAGYGFLRLATDVIDFFSNHFKVSDDEGNWFKRK